MPVSVCKHILVSAILSGFGVCAGMEPRGELCLVGLSSVSPPIFVPAFHLEKEQFWVKNLEDGWVGPSLTW